MLTESKRQTETELRAIGSVRKGLVQGETIEQRRVTAALLDSIARDVVRPVLLIASAAAGLKGGRASNEDVREELVGEIEKETARLEKSLYLLLDMAKLESDCFEISPQTVSIAELVRSLVKDCREELKNRKLEINLPGEPPPVCLDPRILRRVLRLLLENAVGESPPQSTVTIQAAGDGESVRLQVMDQGGGLSRRADQIFEQFHLTPGDSSSNTLGGMGLAVCRGYVEALGGTVDAANRTDRSGAVFTLTFPASGEARRGSRPQR